MILQQHCRHLTGSFPGRVEYKSADRWEYFQLGTSNEQVSIAEYDVSNTSTAGAIDSLSPSACQPQGLNGTL